MNSRGCQQSESLRSSKRVEQDSFDGWYRLRRDFEAPDIDCLVKNRPKRRVTGCLLSSGMGIVNPESGVRRCVRCVELRRPGLQLVAGSDCGGRLLADRHEFFLLDDFDRFHACRDAILRLDFNLQKQHQGTA